ncbi:MAG: hypothetical protein WB821_11075 [Burkholderiaceae bacterium]
MNIGLLGFSVAQRALVESFLALRAQPVDKRAAKKGATGSSVSWQISDYREANALLLNTQRARMDAQQIMRFPSDLQHTDVVGVSPSELSIPYALVGEVSASIHATVAENTPHVTLGDSESMQNTLAFFEASLRPLRTLYTMAQLLLERRNELDDRHTFHLVRRSVLDAIVDVPKQRVMLRDGPRPFELEEADWLARPASANSVPPGFASWSMEELAWLYALHNPEMDLPERYLKLPIYLRQAPQVRPAMIYPRHVALLELLGQEPCGYQRLADAFPQRPDLLQRDLYVLFACRAITTSPQRANLPTVHLTASQPPTTRPAFSATSVQPATQQPFQLETMHAGLH